jgi:glycosyltransferase involved in cell wall biosynthesis
VKVLIVLNKSYHEDPRAQRAISALTQAGCSVIVLNFAERSYSLPDIPNVVFLTCPISRRRSGRLRYVLEYTTYLVWLMFVTSALLVRSRYDVLQISILPEPLVLVALIPRICGVRIVSDWMDLGYELYETKYPARRRDVLHCLIRVSERLVTAISDITIFPNRAFIDALNRRGVTPKESCVILNAADTEVFAPSSRKLSDKARRLVFSGTISRRNGVHVLLEAFKKVRAFVPDCSLSVLGERIDSVCDGITNSSGVDFVGRIRLAEVPTYLRSADIGIIPTSDTPFTRCNVPTRLFELGALGMPVICADLPGIRQYFDERHVLFHVPDDAADLTQCILKLLWAPELQKSLAEGLGQRCAELSWNQARGDYVELMLALGEGRSFRNVRPEKP